MIIDIMMELHILLNPDDDNELNSMTYIIKSDLLHNPNKYENNTTNIKIVLNKQQLINAKLTLKKNNIDVNDFDKLLDKYKQTLFDAYAHYECRGIIKRPIIYADKEYWLFQMFQYKKYEHMKTYINENITT